VYIDFLLEIFEQNKDKDAIIWRDKNYSYGWFSQAVNDWGKELASNGVKANSIVSIEADFSPDVLMRTNLNFVILQKLNTL